MEPVVLSVRPDDDLRVALAGAGIGLNRPVLVCVGGAGGMSREVEREFVDLLERHLVPALDEWDAVVVDGGTDSGLMRSLGVARDSARGSFQLVGVAARGTVAEFDSRADEADVGDIEPHHTHIAIVPGTAWGDESPWISAVAAAIAGTCPSATLLINGGAIALNDADLSLAVGRPLLVLAGTGRAADDIARGTQMTDQVGRIAENEDTQVLPLSDGPAVVRALSTLLGSGR